MSEYGNSGRDSIESLKARISNLEKLNQALIARVEQADAEEGTSDTAVFQNALTLERMVGERTQSLEATRLDLEIANRELLEAKDTAESATQAKTQFLATMSHEIRTPMNGLIGVLHLIEDGLSREKKELMKTAMNSADHLLVLINDILDFSKIEAGKMSIENIRFDALRLVEEVCELYANSAHEKNVELSFVSRPGIDYTSYGDPVRLKQILTNLLSNAIKFTSEGEITVSMTPRRDKDLYSLDFEISDTGIGISESDQKKLFESFEQATTDTARKFGGSGLGLSICKKIVTLMGGEISINSVLDLGTSISFSIPQESRFPLRDESEIQKILSGKNVLIIDPNAVSRRFLKNLHRYWHASVDTARSINEAFDNISSLNVTTGNSHDIIIIDKALIDSNPEQWQRLCISSEHSNLLVAHRSGVDGEFDEEIDNRNTLPKPINATKLRNLFKNLGNHPSPIDEGAFIEPISMRKGGSVLLVDDNPTNRMVAAMLLKQKHGIVPDTAVNGIEAIEAVRKKRYDLVLMDCMMPELDGYDATKMIRKGDAGDEAKSIPIVAVTANAMASDRQACLDAGMNEHLPKPISPSDLAKVVNKWVLKSEENHDKPTVDSSEGIANSLDSGASDELQILSLDRVCSVHENNAEVISELLQLFLATTDDAMHDLQLATESADRKKDVTFHAHKIKGSANEIGAERLASIATGIVMKCRSNMVEEAVACMPELQSAFNELSETVMKKINILSTVGSKIWSNEKAG